VPYAVQNTEVRVLRVKKKTKLWSMHLNFVIVPFYIVGLFIFTIISGFLSKIHTSSLYNIYHTHLLCKYFCMFLNNLSVAVPFFILTCPVQIINSSSKSSCSALLNHFKLSHVSFPISFFHWEYCMSIIVLTDGFTP
jgi:hypothetical protein